VPKASKPVKVRWLWLIIAVASIGVADLAAVIFPGLPVELPIIGRTADLWLAVTIACLLICGLCGAAALFESSHVDAVNARADAELNGTDGGPGQPVADHQRVSSR
jgi:hypothetical protein